MRTRTVILSFLCALVLPLLVAAPARAELYHPRQAWLRDATAGLFLHWGMRTDPGYTDCAAWEKAVTDGGWSADYWVREARKLHASYLVLASFHSRLGYARAWPSKIPGSCSTQRDFLGELVTAAHREKLRVILYMTDDPQWWWEGLPEGQSWFDSAAYSAYKGEQVDLQTRPGFGEYSYDNFVEVMANHPSLDGFWIDNDNAYWEENGLYERIRAERPHMLLSNNNEDTPIMDTMSNEQKTGMTPPYDYPAAVLTPMPRLTEACFKLPSKGAWWYDGQDSDIDWPLSIGRYVTNTGASVKNLVAETAMVNGRFPPKQEQFNDFMRGYLDQIWESLSGVEGAGYMYGGMQPGSWNDGAHGAITIGKKDRATQYVHVVTRPAGAELRIRDNGYLVGKVTNLRTGKAVKFDQKDGYLTLHGITSWDPYDTVFKVRTLTRLGAYPSGWLTPAASASLEGHPAADLADGDYLTWWDSDTTVPVSITLKLRASLPVKYLAINQREWSPTYSRVSFGRPEDSARIRDYRIFASQDGVTWGEPVRTGVLESARGVRFIDLDLKRARYLKLQVDSIWAAPSAPNFYQKLRIDELWAGGLYPRR